MADLIPSADAIQEIRAIISDIKEEMDKDYEG